MASARISVNNVLSDLFTEYHENYGARLTYRRNKGVLLSGIIAFRWELSQCALDRCIYPKVKRWWVVFIKSLISCECKSLKHNLWINLPRFPPFLRRNFLFSVFTPFLAMENGRWNQKKIYFPQKIRIGDILNLTRVKKWKRSKMKIKPLRLCDSIRCRFADFQMIIFISHFRHGIESPIFRHPQ